MHYIQIQKSGEKIFPGKILCVGRNYTAHALELGNEVPEFPIVFLKSSSVIIHSGDKIQHPIYAEDLHHEVELVLLIGKDLKNADINQADEAIIGYAVGLDMTLRDLQSELKRKGQPWTLAKNFDGSAVISDFVLRDDYELRGDENIELCVNNVVRQNSDIGKMIFSPAELVKYLSEKMTLERGDLIFTGTPAGVGKVSRGDKIFAKLENIGELFTEII